MARRRHRSGGDCTRKRISFKAHGKTVSFMGRPGGMKSAGGSCSDKHRSTRHLTSYKSAFKKAAHACAGKSHARHGKHGKSAYNRCVGAKLK
jgi:hypothetical protein